MKKERDKNSYQLPHLGLFVIIIISCSYLMNCDETFQTRADNDFYTYSMYGYLDATVDTQWIRIMPVRLDFDFIPGDEIDAHVTIKNLTTGEEEVMHDSLFTPNELANYWNFWTTLPINYEHVYEIVAERSDGEKSIATVTIPPDYPTPIYGGERLSVEGIDRVAAVNVFWEVYLIDHDEFRIFSFSHRVDSSINRNGAQRFALNPSDDISSIKRRMGAARNVITNMQILIAAGGYEWVNVFILDDLVYTLPEGVSNVEHGVGYVFGAITKVIPAYECINETDPKFGLEGCEVELEDRLMNQKYIKL